MSEISLRLKPAENKSLKTYSRLVQKWLASSRPAPGNVSQQANILPPVTAILRLARAPYYIGTGAGFLVKRACLLNIYYILAGIAQSGKLYKSAVVFLCPNNPAFVGGYGKILPVPGQQNRIRHPINPLPYCAEFVCKFIFCGFYGRFFNVCKFYFHTCTSQLTYYI